MDSELYADVDPDTSEIRIVEVTPELFNSNETYRVSAHTIWDVRRMIGDEVEGSMLDPIGRRHTVSLVRWVGRDDVLLAVQWRIQRTSRPSELVGTVYL
jgi:hypothetical protein